MIHLVKSLIYFLCANFFPPITFKYITRVSLTEICLVKIDLHVIHVSININYGTLLELEEILTYFLYMCVYVCVTVSNGGILENSHPCMASWNLATHNGTFCVCVYDPSMHFDY